MDNLDWRELMTYDQDRAVRLLEGKGWVPCELDSGEVYMVQATAARGANLLCVDRRGMVGVWRTKNKVGFRMPQSADYHTLPQLA